jgi:uncharacterized membrane protein
MDGIAWVTAASATFVATHLILSHPLRRPFVAAVGEGPFSGIYSVAALASFVWMILAFRAAPMSAFVWPVGDGLWAAVTLVMLVASILLMGSFIRNPAFPSGGAAAVLPTEARGVYAITRLPMLWSFALWGVCHIAIFPVGKNIVVASAIIALALIGGALQDQKKARLLPAVWPVWQSKTSYWPFAAIVAGRARLSALGWHAIGGGIVIWLVATWAHIPLSGWPAGIWRWLR